jgi:ribonucleotide monophosphatase NagD (HAD superfamily)
LFAAQQTQWRTLMKIALRSSTPAKGLKLLCANPNHRRSLACVREWCASCFLAALYTEMGGEAFIFGKPLRPPIYDLARRRLALR